MGSSNPPWLAARRNSAVRGLAAGRGVLEASGFFGFGWAAASLLEWLRLRSASGSGRAAPKPNCRGPVDTRWFPEGWGRRTLLRSPGLGCVPHPDLGWRFRGARFGGRAVGPMLDGDRPRSLPFVAGGGTAVGGGRWLAGGQRVGEIRITIACGACAQIRMRAARSRVPRCHIKTRQCIVRSGQCPRVPRSPLINLNVL